MTSFKLLHHLKSALLVILIVLLPSLSHAADGERGEWYGWQVMPVDAASIGLMSYTIVWGHRGTKVNNFLGYTGLAAYTFGAPIVHLAHQQWWEASGSLGLRLGLPMVGAFTASALLGDGGSLYDLPWIVVGAGVGAVAAVALDYAFLAHHPPSQSKHAASQTQVLQLQWHF